MSPVADYWSIQVGDFVYRKHLTLERAAAIARKLMGEVHEVQIIQESLRWYQTRVE